MDALGKKLELLSAAPRGYLTLLSCSPNFPRASITPRGGTPLFGLYGDVPLDRVWFFGLAVLNRVYNLTCLCPKRVKDLS